MLGKLLAAKSMLALPNCCEVYMAAVAYTSAQHNAPFGSSADTMQMQGPPGTLCAGKSDAVTAATCDAAATVELLHILPVSKLPNGKFTRAASSSRSSEGGAEVTLPAPSAQPQHCMSSVHDDVATAVEGATHDGRETRPARGVHGMHSCMQWMHGRAAELLGEFAFGTNGVARSDSPGGILKGVDTKEQRDSLEQLGWTVLQG